MNQDVRKENCPLVSRSEAKKRFLKAYYALLEERKWKNHHIAEDLGMNLSTVKESVNYSTPNLNAEFVIAFCLKYKTIDIKAIYQDDVEEPVTPETQKENFTVFRHSRDCHVLEDEAFMGTFYGYCRYTQYDHTVDRFVLTVGKDTYDTVQAKLALDSRNQRGERIQKTLFGKPMHLEPDTIYIVFQGDAGDDLFIMMYSWFKISMGKHLYCRYGSLSTPCRATNRFPQMQSFLMLDKPVTPANMHFVDGYLRLSQDKIIVPADKYDAQSGGLLATNETVKTFFGRCKDLQYSKEPYYCFSEKVLLAMGEANGVDYDTTAATIMTLKENSVNPKVIDFPNNKTYSKFFAGLTSDEQ